jgi:flagellar hook-associated protein 1 FlgK
MPGLFHILSIGSEGLQAARQGVDTTGHNIANAQVEGYSRQRVNVKPRDPLMMAHYQIGNGAFVKDITRAHDKFIEAQLIRAKQEAGNAAALHDAWKAIELVFSPELTSTIPDQISSFFGSLEDLSASPDDPNIRTAVVESAKDLSLSFKRVDRDLKEHKGALEDKIKIATVEISDKLKAVADLNLKIQVAEAGNPESACDLRDQRDKTVRDLSSLIDIHHYEDLNGMVCVRGPGEVNLVDGVHASSLTVGPNPDRQGSSDIVILDWDGKSPKSITKKVENGSLKALLDLRDVELPRLIDKNNEMAYGLMTNFNAVHRQGFGLRGYAESSGRDFFREPQSRESAAANMDLEDCILESIDTISMASTPLAAGDNVILNRLIKLKDANLLEDGSMNLNEFYASYAGETGFRVARAAQFEEVSNVIAQDLTKRREGVSGVSLDEEATNMLKWQANFTASSKVITTCDEMIETVLGLKR